MKKLFLSLLVGAASLTASAQVYVGGEVGLWRNADDNHTSFSLKPHVGYELSNKWAIGTSIGFTHDYYGGDHDEILNTKVNGFSIDPYARWTYAKFGPVKLFLDLGFGINTAKAKYELLENESYSSDASVAWRIGVTPGVSVALAKNISFTAHAGFLGYREADGKLSPYGETGFGFEVSSYDLNFGLSYHF